MKCNHSLVRVFKKHYNERGPRHWIIEAFIPSYTWQEEIYLCWKCRKEFEPVVKLKKGEK
jgi:hypothetical protein